MIKNLLLIILTLASVNASSQTLGYLISANPNTASQGQSLTTTVTNWSGAFMTSSPPCDNYGIFLLQGSDTIYSTAYNWLGFNDQIEVDFTIPAAAPLGFYDIYVAGAYYDWWWGTCTTIGYWLLNNGFEVTANPNNVGINQEQNFAFVSPNPIRDNSVIRFSNPERKKYKLTIKNLFGQTVFEDATDKDQITIGREKIYAGVYYYTLGGTENESSFTGKFVVTNE